MSVEEATKSARKAMKNLELVAQDEEILSYGMNVQGGDAVGFAKERRPKERRSEVVAMQAYVPQRRNTSLNRVKRNTAQRQMIEAALTPRASMNKGRRKEKR